MLHVQGGTVVTENVLVEGDLHVDGAITTNGTMLPIAYGVIDARNCVQVDCPEIVSGSPNVISATLSSLGDTLVLIEIANEVLDDTYVLQCNPLNAGGPRFCSPGATGDGKLSVKCWSLVQQHPDYHNLQSPTTVLFSFVVYKP